MGMKASCHCGAIELHVPSKPESLTSCNCSICHRLGAQWAYYPYEDVGIRDPEDLDRGYEHGDRMIRFHHCSRCGVPTHWSSIEKSDNAKIAVNARLFETDQIADVPVRRFDGRDSWAFFEEEG